MSDLPFESDKKESGIASMWPIAALILLVVFAPAVMVWAMGLLQP